MFWRQIHGSNSSRLGTCKYLDRWITLCHKNSMTTLVIICWRQRVMSLRTSVSTISFLNEIMFSLKAINSHFKGSYDKQNLTRVVISYEIYETRRRLVS